MSRETYRPRYHFSPPSGWMNDPNGLVYHRGVHHLFYQHARDGLLHWGHAQSADAVRWQHLPVALLPNELGQIFSGSAVAVSERKGALLPGDERLVAVYTQHNELAPPRGPEVQCAAESTDGGISFTPFAHNPVLPNPGLRDMRDPKVFWHRRSSCWIMVLACGRSLCFYASRDLASFERLSEFSSDDFGPGVWECPDLMHLPVTGHEESQWVLLVSLNDEGGLGSRTYYVLGDFDGARFSRAGGAPRLFDAGPDNYASVSFSGGRDRWKRPLAVGWMNNWLYARDVPTLDFQGVMTLPRRLALRRSGSELTLVQAPTDALHALRQARLSLDGLTVGSGEELRLPLNGESYELELELDLGNAEEAGVALRVGQNERTTLSFERASSSVCLDRTRSGNVGFHPAFASRQAAAVPSDGSLSLRVFVDRCSVEVFAAGGAVVLSALIFPSRESQGLTLFSRRGALRIARGAAYELACAG